MYVRMYVAVRGGDVRGAATIELWLARTARTACLLPPLPGFAGVRCCTGLVFFCLFLGTYAGLSEHTWTFKGASCYRRVFLHLLHVVKACLILEKEAHPVHTHMHTYIHAPRFIFAFCSVLVGACLAFFPLV